MGSNNLDYINDVSGLGLDLWFRTRPYNASPDTWTDSAKAVGSHDVDSQDSEILTSIFKAQNGKSISRFVKSKLASNTNDDVNDTSLISIIEFLQKWRATYVDYADFAYLKNVGVYPTNRLMIARRFASPVGNNLYSVDADPMATMISWVPDNTDFFKVSFGETWEQGDVSFITLMNTMGKDWAVEGAGDFVEKSITPFPGAAEYIQIEVAKKLGIAGDYDTNNPPLGNPNLILQSKKRALISKERGQGDSGLSSTFTINFVVEYEQKFINNVDPALIYLDIIQKGLIFGTSKSVFYFGGGAQSEFSEFYKNLVSGEASAIIKSLWELSTNIISSLLKVLADVAKDKDGAFQTLVKTTIGQLVSKYRTRLFSVIQALTGAPSGCWHVTIGNPKKPIFCSGDLLIGGSEGGTVTMTLGKQLSYNDLPSSIKFEFSLSPARTLGGQEIFDRFNTGVGRTYFQDIRSWVEVPLQVSGEGDNQTNQTTSDSVEKRLQNFREKLKEAKDNDKFTN